MTLFTTAVASGTSKWTSRMPLRGGTSQPLTDENRFELLVAAISDDAIYTLDAEGFFTPEDQQSRLPEKILETARNIGRHEAEGWRVRKNGTRFWSNAILQAMRDDKGTLMGFAKITRDITERTQA